MIVRPTRMKPWTPPWLRQSVSQRRWFPKDYGCPVARPRVYPVLYRKDKFAFSGCQEELDRFLCQSLLCTGQVFFQDADGSSPLAAVSLNKTQNDSLDLYRRKSVSGVAGDTCDLNQRPPFGSLQSFVPCLLTRSGFRFRG